MASQVEKAYSALHAHNAAIGELIGARPTQRWAVMDAAEQGMVIWFDGFGAEDAAADWLRGQRPEHVAANGWHAVRHLLWDDYLSLHGGSAAACQFIDWGFRQPKLADAAALLELHRNAASGFTVSQAMGALFLGEDVLHQIQLAGIAKRG